MQEDRPVHPKDEVRTEEGIVHPPGAIDDAPDAREVDADAGERNSEEQVPKLPTDPPF